MKRKPCWRILRCTIRRFLLSDGFVIAAAGMNPPRPTDGGARGTECGKTSTSRSRGGEVERLSVCGRRDGPPLAPPSKGGESWRNIRGGKSPLRILQVINRPRWRWADEKRAVLGNFEVDDSAFSVARRFFDGGRRDGPPLAPPSKGGESWRNIRGGKSPLRILQVINRPRWRWADEKRAVLGNFEVDDSAFSVARRFFDGGRWDGPPLAPPSKGGESWRNTCGGESSFVRSQVFNRPPWPPLLKRGKFGAAFAPGNLRSLYGKFSTAHCRGGWR